jgi:5-methylcytosine-specific restriction endonuclease McrA
MRKVKRTSVRLIPSLATTSPGLIEQKKALRNYFNVPPGRRQQLRAPVDLSLLKQSDVLDNLRSMFAGKCAYCESKLIHTDGVVSHFRPPSNAASSKNMPDSPEYYSWLAYEWRNILLLCERCDSFKQNYFPVRGVRAEPLGLWQDAQRTERPLLLDPTHDDPCRHLSVDSQGLLSHLSEEGKVTIAVLGLNRLELIERRQTLVADIFVLLSDTGREANNMLGSAMSDDAEYAGVVALYLFGLCRQIALEIGFHRKIPFAEFKSVLMKWRRELSPSEWLNTVARANDRPPRAIEDELATASSEFYDSKREQRVLTSILIENLKGIESLRLELTAGTREAYAAPPSAMLLGENATCKSTVLQAVTLALMSKRDRARLRLKPTDFIPRVPHGWVLDFQKSPRVILGFRGGEIRTLEYDSERGEFYTPQEDNFTVLAYGARRYFHRRNQGRRPAATNKTLFDPLALLGDPSLWLEQADEHTFNAVVRAMRPVLSLRDDEEIVRLRDGRVMVSAHGRVTPIGEMGDGYRVVFAMATDIMRHMVEIWGNLELARGIVLIDEIETHLHPRWKRQVMSALRDAMPRVQFIATTHDPLCLRGMRNGEVHVLYRDEEAQVALVEDLPDISTLRAEQILTSDYFGLASTADTGQERILMRLAQLAGRSEVELSLDERAERDRLLSNFDGLPVIGDSVDRQILAEAMTRHLRRNDKLTLSARAGQREDSIERIVGVLERAMAK